MKPVSKVRTLGLLAALVAVAGITAGLAGAATAPPVTGKAIAITGGYTGPPPAKLGIFQMTPFAPDAYADFDPVCSLPAPWTYQGALGPQGNVVLGGFCDFEARTVPTNWLTWSHGYAGRVYYSNGWNVETLAMPAQTGAFYAYVEPNSMSTYLVTAAGTDVLGRLQQASMYISGASGAALVGVSMPNGGEVKSLTIDCGSGLGSCGGFAIGELAIAGPKLTRVS
jgi:hypothetical protein